MNNRSKLTNLALSALLLLQPTCAFAQVDDGPQLSTESGSSKDATAVEGKPTNILAPGQTINKPTAKATLERVSVPDESTEPKKVDSKETEATEATKPEVLTDEEKAEIKSPKASPSLSVEMKLEKLAKEKAATEERAIEKAKSAEAKDAVTAKSGAKKESGSFKLFGRIEQISASGDVKMPVLKAMTATMDPRGQKLKGEADENHYSGTIANNFPEEFTGQWGGSMQVWSYHYSPYYLKVDQAEAVQSVKILKKGRNGVVNFNFYRDSKGKTALQPAEVLVSIPMKDSYTFSQMMKGSGVQGQVSPFGKEFQNVMGNMEAPMIKINFGNFQTDGVMTTGVSGNQARQTVVKNAIRQLAPNVVEQQIITKVVSRVKGKNKTNTGYAESVLRFKKLNSQKLYVLAATVNYTSGGKYLDKLIMYGTVDRGRLVQTDPMAGMNKMMGGMMNLEGLGNMFGMPTSGSGKSSPITIPGLGGAAGTGAPRGQTQIQGMPKGFDPYEILKRMNH